MTTKAHESAKIEWLWRIAMVYFGVICLVDYHYSISNEIPSDGPLRIGFPMTFYWMVCPMISAGAGACQQGISALGLIVDLTTCVVFAIIAATVTMYFAEKNLIKRKQFWISTGITFALIFLLASVVTALFPSPRHGRALEVGFPVVYLREYAGESWSLLNLAVDLVICFVVSFVIVALFFMDKTDGSMKAHLK
jgi:hypothetical protein